MSYINAKSFVSAREYLTPASLSARVNLLTQLDERMATYAARKTAPISNCPEHLYSIDEDKMDAARFLDR